MFTKTLKYIIILLLYVHVPISLGLCIILLLNFIFTLFTMNELVFTVVSFRKVCVFVKLYTRMTLFDLQLH